MAVIAVMNLRGVRESGTAFAIPTYVFIGVVGLMIIWGVTRLALGHPLEAESAHLHVPAHEHVHRVRCWSGCCCGRSRPAAPR